MISAEEEHRSGPVELLRGHGRRSGWTGLVSMSALQHAMTLRKERVDESGTLKSDERRSSVTAPLDWQVTSLFS
ncbi:hypothetical protein RhiXN_04698 [Rhizoctonia solani]|uniref:Uncharacterized protein n=1 Tax=Rhizoctonia solani TaxID=456999 RepID=A0A8H8NMV0_9AGAM|nr:uncharacterized protein RhiXN_04698 [Rhizoctonia solani]QRW16696.1 hypothetical protein RhiXN_04698 [Rhizoctonia solani]